MCGYRGRNYTSAGSRCIGCPKTPTPGDQSAQSSAVTSGMVDEGYMDYSISDILKRGNPPSWSGPVPSLGGE